MSYTPSISSATVISWVYNALSLARVSNCVSICSPYTYYHYIHILQKCALKCLSSPALLYLQQNTVVEGERLQEEIPSDNTRKAAVKCSAPASEPVYLEARSTYKKETPIKSTLRGKYVSLSSHSLQTDSWWCATWCVLSLV